MLQSHSLEEVTERGRGVSGVRRTRKGARDSRQVGRSADCGVSEEQGKHRPTLLLGAETEMTEATGTTAGAGAAQLGTRNPSTGPGRREEKWAKEHS